MRLWWRSRTERIVRGGAETRTRVQGCSTRPSPCRAVVEDLADESCRPRSPVASTCRPARVSARRTAASPPDAAGSRPAGAGGDEPHGVRNGDLALAREPQAPRSRVEGREHLVGDVHLGARQGPQQRALARIRIADDGQNRDRAAPPPLPPVLALRGELLQLAFEPGQAIPGTPAVDLELRLAGSPSADAAGESRQRNLGALREPRQQVLELRQLHLELAVARGRMLREDVEDELRAVYARSMREGELADQTANTPGNHWLTPTEVGVGCSITQESAAGFTVKEIPFNPIKGIEPEEYESVAETLYNRSADLQNRLQEAASEDGAERGDSHPGLASFANRRQQPRHLVQRRRVPRVHDRRAREARHRRRRQGV